MIDKMHRHIEALMRDPRLTREEGAVLALIGTMPMTQRQIVKSERWLGCHPKHEAEVVLNEFESTTRMVRAIIRSLRIKHKVPILAGSTGYYLPRSEAEARRFVNRMEREAKARARASLETYNAMREMIGIQSSFFDSLQKQFEFEASQAIN